MTEWERSREQEEFVRACILYRPSTSLLSSRFTRAKQQDDDEAVEVNRDQEVRTHREVTSSALLSPVPSFPTMHLLRVLD